MSATKTTPERGAGFWPRILHPLRRPTLVETLQRDISRSDDAGPDWLLEVAVACQRQDMEWELQVWDEADSSLLAGQPFG